MIIKRNSISYQTIELANVFYPSNSLCIYFWQVVISGLWVGAVWLMGTVLALLIALGAGSLILGPIIWLIAGLQTGVWVVDHLLFPPVLVVGGFLGAAAIYFTPAALRYIVRFLRRHVSLPESEPNVVTSYIKAKKEKVCPVITFEGGR